MSNQSIRVGFIDLGLGVDTKHLGASVNIFFSGCSRTPKCVGCHNPILWDKDVGANMGIEEILNEINHYTNTKYVVFTGGEPLDQQEGLRELAWAIKRRTNKETWLYTGVNLEDIPSDIAAPMDTIVAGPYEPARKSAKYPATDNQIVIHKAKERRHC